MHLLCFFTIYLLRLVHCVPPKPPIAVGDTCGAQFGDCAGSLHCIPLAPDCTRFSTCLGKCEDLSTSPQKIYTLCGGWSYLDDCDERVENCIADPRHASSCGPSCDAMGICAITKEICGGDYDLECPPGKVCFGEDKAEWGEGWPPRLCERDESRPEGYKCAAYCFPLRFGSDEYAKSREWEVIRTDQDGDQREDDEA